MCGSERPCADVLVLLASSAADAAGCMPFLLLWSLLEGLMLRQSHRGEVHVQHPCLTSGPHDKCKCLHVRMVLQHCLSLLATTLSAFTHLGSTVAGLRQ